MTTKSINKLRRWGENHTDLNVRKNSFILYNILKEIHRQYKNELYENKTPRSEINAKYQSKLYDEVYNSKQDKQTTFAYLDH